MGFQGNGINPNLCLTRGFGILCPPRKKASSVAQDAIPGNASLKTRYKTSEIQRHTIATALPRLPAELTGEEETPSGSKAKQKLKRSRIAWL